MYVAMYVATYVVKHGLLVTIFVLWTNVHIATKQLMYVVKLNVLLYTKNAAYETATNSLGFWL